MSHPSIRPVVAFLLLSFWVVGATGADSAPAPTKPGLIGRWDLKVQQNGEEYPSWMEVRLSGRRTLVGAFVGRFGSARPVSEVKFDPSSGQFRFSIPPQWEDRMTDIVVEGKLEGDQLTGGITGDQGRTNFWTGTRAPLLLREGPVKWGKPLTLFNGRDLTGWKQRHKNKPNGWRVNNGVLVNEEPGNDLMTEEVFGDFKLQLKFRCPKGSNSGIYLRGRYEIQIEDNYGRQPDSHEIGGLYGYLPPRINASKQAGEWQSFEITLIGREVTIVLNGQTIIDRQTIPGITGGALDSDEAKPGPLLIQGDHGRIEYKDLILTPAK